MSRLGRYPLIFPRQISTLNFIRLTHWVEDFRISALIRDSGALLPFSIKIRRQSDYCKSQLPYNNILMTGELHYCYYSTIARWSLLLSITKSTAAGWVATRSYVQQTKLTNHPPLLCVDSICPVSWWTLNSVKAINYCDKSFDK